MERKLRQFNAENNIFPEFCQILIRENASVHEIIKEAAKEGAKPDLQCSQRGELLKGARLYPPDLVMLQASVEKHTHTAHIKMCNPEI